MARKQCKSCGAEVGLRTLVCACGAKFHSKAPVKDPVKPAKPEVIEQVEKIFSSNKRRTLTPSGECPVTPKGYKRGWTDGPASEAVIKSWAIDVYNSHNGVYTVDAVIYWARFFWDMHGSEYSRVREVIWQTLSPSTPPDLQFC